MKFNCLLVNASQVSVYVTEVPSSLPASDYTARFIPCFMNIPVPSSSFLHTLANKK